MKWVLYILVLMYAANAMAQETIVDAVSEQNLSLQEPEDGEESFENLSHLLAEQINLNTATANDLRLLNVLSDDQIQAILTHRKETGRFLSTLELQSIAGIDLETIETLVPYVRVVDPSSEINVKLLHRMKTESDAYVLMRFEANVETLSQRKNDTQSNDDLSGIPGKAYFRIRSSRPGDFSYGITAEHDAGEPFRFDPIRRYYGPDFLSGHVQLQNKGRIKNIILGDYQAQFGQGLVWGGIAGMGKGSESITSPRRINLGFAPYTSAYESGNLRGIASTVELPYNFKLSSCISAQRRDGTISNDKVTTIQTSGLHRTESEMERRKSWHEIIFGGSIYYQKKALEAGITFQQFRSDKTIIPETRLYNSYAFTGSGNTNVGVYGSYVYRNITFFSETAVTLTKGYGIVSGVIMTLAPKFDVTILQRVYTRNYQPLFGNGFSENTKSQNEAGTYWGWKYKFNRRWTHSGYVDLFQFRNLKYRVYGPSRGFETLLRFTWQPSRSTQVSWQGRIEEKHRNQINEEKTYQVLPVRKYNYWINLDYGLNQKLRMKSRLQYSEFSQHAGLSSGFSLAQDFIYQVGKCKAAVRYALFDTDDWDNRHYFYEQDVWLAYSLPAYDGTGAKKIIMFEYKFSKQITVWIRYSCVKYRDRNIIGTGVDQILGNTRNDIKLQVRVRL